MAEGCSSYPTLTRTEGVRTESVFTTFTSTITTVPSSLSTYTVTPSCTLSTCVASPTVITTEIPGYTLTTQVPITLTSFIDTTTVTTLWGSTCTRSETGSRSISRPASRTQSESAYEITSLAISTRPDGRITSSVVTVTATPLDQAFDNPKKSNLIPIIGGVAGGLVGLIIAVLLAWYCLRKRATKAGFDNLFNKVQPHVNRHDHDPEKVGYSQQQQEQLQHHATERRPQEPPQPLQQQPDVSRHDSQQVYQADQQETNDPRDEKQRLKQTYEEMDNLMTHGTLAAGGAHNAAGPSTAVISPAAGYYNPAVTTQLPSGSVQYPSASAVPTPGPGYSHYPAGPQVGYTSVHADPRMSQYAGATGVSRPTSTVEGHRHSGYYQPSPQGTAHLSPAQPQAPLSPVPGPSTAYMPAPGGPLRSEKQMLVHLDGEQYVNGAGPSGAAPPPAYTERG